MKVAVFEVEPRETAAFESLRLKHEVVSVGDPLRADTAGGYADTDVVPTFIYSDLSRDLLTKLPSLKLAVSD